MTPSLLIEDSIATIFLRRPEVANRLQHQDLIILAEHVATVNAAPEVRVLCLRGEGRNFCAGADITQVGPEFGERFEQVIREVETARPVTVAAVHGGVFGGAVDLALACDFRLGGSKARMSVPAARLGLHFYRQGLERFVSRLGVDVTKRLLLAAEELDAVGMHAIGFLTHLSAHSHIDEEVRHFSTSLAEMAPIPLLRMKMHLNDIARGSLNAEALAIDIARSINSQDLREGITALRERRKPWFSGS